jgi:DNA-binding CsgD family transcriptional regulator/PAS domain-containing protein
MEEGMSVTKLDLDPLLDLAYGGVVLEGTWSELLLRLNIQLDASQIGLFRHSILTGTGDIQEAVGITPDFQSRYLSMSNVWLRDKHRLSPGGVASGAELIPPWELVSTDFYRMWLRPQQAFQSLIGVVAQEESVVHCLIAFRPGRMPEFEDSRRALLAAVLPHLRRSFDLAAAFNQISEESRLGLRLLDRIPEAVLVVNRNGIVQMHNASAKHLLSERDGLLLVAGRLSAVIPKENHHLSSLLSQASEGKRAPAAVQMRIGRPSGHPLMLTICPIEAMPNGGETDQPLIAVFVSDPSRYATPSVNQLRHLFRLTPAEARLATLVLTERSLHAAATILNISKNTARTHMKRIHAKTETATWSDLQRLLDTTVWDLQGRSE